MGDKAKNIHTENSEELPDIDHFIKKINLLPQSVFNWIEPAGLKERTTIEFTRGKARGGFALTPFSRYSNRIRVQSLWD